MSDQSNKTQILVVEQEAFLARIICRGLRTAGLEVVHLTTGEAALEHLIGKPADVVIVATDMHPMNGEEFCRRLQTEQPDRKFPVFVMTDSAQDMYNRWNHWFSNFRMIDKPISLRFILESIEKHLSQTA